MKANVQCNQKSISLLFLEVDKADERMNGCGSNRKAIAELTSPFTSPKLAPQASIWRRSLYADAVRVLRIPGMGMISARRVGPSALE